MSTTAWVLIIVTNFVYLTTYYLLRRDCRKDQIYHRESVERMYSNSSKVTESVRLAVKDIEVAVKDNTKALEILRQSSCQYFLPQHKEEEKA